jgi:two-component system chemotaxis response regulator CheB
MRYDVVTIVASRRGISQLRDLVSHLPPQFGIPIVCLAEADSRLVADLSASTPLEVKWAQAGEELRPGCVYLSPPGASIVLLESRRISLSPIGPESTAHHPVDSFLMSAGRAFGNRVLSVVLGAFREDGAEGAHSLKWRGGTVLILDRATAEFYGMADAIVHRGSYDLILSAVEVGEALRASFTGQDLLANAEIQFELNTLLDSALRLSGTDMGNIRIAERGRARLHIVAHRGLGRHYLDRFAVVPAESDLACARALRFAQRVVVEDALNDPGYCRHADIVRITGFCAVQATPIHEEPGGVFTTFYRHAHAVTAAEGESLDRIALAARETIARFSGR